MKKSDFKKEKDIKNIDIINSRKVINSVDDGLMQIHPLKHPWADEIFRTMLHNNWIPQEIPLNRDVDMWYNDKTLTENERRIFKRSLAFVSNLDGLQTNNLVENIIRHITSPEICLALSRQIYEEALHVYSYSTMVETLRLDPEEIYGLYRKDHQLYKKNNYVLQSFSQISDPHFKTGTFENDQHFLEACCSNIILEGIYFFNAFLSFYILHRNNKMQGSAEMIKFINRDEDMHLRLFTYIVNSIKQEQPELWTDSFQKRIIKNFVGACEHEITWGKSCIKEGILGLTPDDVTQYIQFVTDVRLKSIDLPKYFNSNNPFLWIDEYTQGSMIEANFFESTVREYATGTLNWDD